MYDVIIVGAGPAGSTCARHCALAGLKTALIDKNHFPRQKTCGGAVSGRAISYLDFPLPAAFAEDECFGARIFHGRHSVVVQKEERLAVLVDREQFDELLLDKAIEAGAQFLPGEHAVSVHVGNESIVLHTDTGVHEALFLVGADGVHSVIAQSVRPRLSREEIAVALVSHVAVNESSSSPQQDGFVDMHFGVAPQGYGWVFPRRSYNSVGVMGVASHFSHAYAALAGFSRDLGMATADVRGHLIPLGGIKRKISSRRVLLAGDAAGFVDPFHGEGIAYAILSGKLAAQSICRVLMNGWEPGKAFRWYELQCEQIIRKNLRVALWMAKLLDRYPKLFIRIFFDNPRALAKYMDISTGRLEYQRFWKWIALRIPGYLLASYLRTLRRSTTTRKRSMNTMDAT
jgi:geranylgeranyl reductase family protein